MSFYDFLTNILHLSAIYITFEAIDILYLTVNTYNAVMCEQSEAIYA